MLLGKLGTHLRVPPTHSPFFTTVRTYGKRKVVWVLNKQGRKLQVDIRDAGKAKYRYLYPKKSSIPAMDERKNERGGQADGQSELRGHKSDKPEV
jgi:hypothetical protein